MSAARQRMGIGVQDYLLGERSSRIKHEYVGGFVYAMAGTSNRHPTIAMNIGAAAHFRLRGKPCRPFGSDTKIYVRTASAVRFYYPDLSIVCQLADDVLSYQDKPAVIFDVLSRATRRLDEGEKKDGYLTLPSLAVYVLLEQDSPFATVHRRVGEAFAVEAVEGLQSNLALPEVGLELPFTEIYEGVRFGLEPDDELP